MCKSATLCALGGQQQADAATAEAADLEAQRDGADGLHSILTLYQPQMYMGNNATFSHTHKPQPTDCLLC